MMKKGKECASSINCRFRFAMRLTVVLTLLGIGIAWYLH
jgi:hypothetical protein